MDRPPTTLLLPATAFRTFWMGGFEGADHVNGNGRALDMATQSGHLARLERDFADAAGMGIGTVRESLGWRLAETAPGRFDLSRLRRIHGAAAEAGVQVVWTLMHYGLPPDLDYHDDRLIDRFAAFAAAAARVRAELDDEAPIWNPINEIGFVAWSASETDWLGRRPGSTAMHGSGNTLASGYSIKRRLVRAALAGIEAMRRVDPRARFVHVEPLVHVVAPRDRPELHVLAEQVASYQWQAWDLLAGHLEPDLGGSPAALDILGANHYHSGQWEVATEARLHWHERDPRRKPLGSLLEAAWQRYRRPLFIAETSHFGDGRAAWLDEVAAEVERARRAGVPVGGVCLYPLVDRADWNDDAHWHHSGLWDIGETIAEKRLDGAYAAVLRRWQGRLGD